MKLDPVMMECSKCKTETTHLVRFAKRSEAEGVYTSTCEVCGTELSAPISLPRGSRITIEQFAAQISKFGAYKREIVKPKPSSS